MSTRLEIELTSVRADGSFTWRKAGAKQPKGEVPASVLPAGSSVGDVMRVEADVAIDGIEILSVVPGRERKSAGFERLELKGRPAPESLVTQQLAKGRRRRDDDRPDRGDRRERRPRRDGDRDRSRPEGGDRGPRRDRPQRDRVETPRAPRLRPSRKHRNAVLSEIEEPFRPIAEQVLRGGVPAVRQAVDKQNASNREAGLPEIHGDELVGLAERLLPKLRSAEWRDRAEAAANMIDTLDLRDLRSVVVAADGGARDDETRALAATLREALTRRVEEEHAQWLRDIQQALTDERLVRALRLSSRPPKAGAPLPPAIVEGLQTQTMANLTRETTAQRWAIVIDALAFSPIRTRVEPTEALEAVTDELREALEKTADRLPHIAALYGVSAKKRRGSRPSKKASPAPIPPPPKLTAAPAPEPEQAAAPAPEPEQAAAPAPEPNPEPEQLESAESDQLEDPSGAVEEPVATDA